MVMTGSILNRDRANVLMNTPTLTTELPIRGMDCAECTQHVRAAIASQPGVEAVEVYLAAEKAVIRYHGDLDLPALEHAVARAGYQVGAPATGEAALRFPSDKPQRPMLLLGAVFGLVLLAVIFGEWLGGFELLSNQVPWPIWLALILLLGYPVFRNVLRAARDRRIIAHTLMTLGVLAAAAIGEWATALVVVIFMRVGDYIETYTTNRARNAVRRLDDLAPRMARVEREGAEVEIEAGQIQPGVTVIVRPGEIIPVDGVVVSGNALVDQAAITGESSPVEAGPGAEVFAATYAHLGSLRIRTTHAGPETTFGQVLRLVEEAEANRAEVERAADRFSTYFLPLVAGIAGFTFLLTRNPIATAAVLVVACSCAFTLATPIAMLASIGAGARRGLLIKGGKYLELLAGADVLLIDKTGTLTLGKPVIKSIYPLDGKDEDEILALAASAERYAEHPLARSIREAAQARDIHLEEPLSFDALPGLGIEACIGEKRVQVGGQRILDRDAYPEIAAIPESAGETLTYVLLNGRPAGVLATADALRPEVPRAIQTIRDLGIRKIELLTGDHQNAAAPIAEKLGIPYRAGLTPEDKIRIVREYQSDGSRVIMVGDGVNDAPALAQADVSIAMGASGSDVAIEAAHIALLADDWSLVPEVIQIARTTMRVVRGNIGFTAVYNLIGITLAALGILPPGLAAAAQSIPDLGILGNSSRLLKIKQ
jgi:P-type Cu+ transporter